MTKLLILADDFTGALDTGIQFKKRGISTCVMNLNNSSSIKDSCCEEVLVVNTNTRALSKNKAYQIIKEIVAEAKVLSIPWILKKTDSALRGNIGAELAAVMDAIPELPLYFIPALPEMNRITKEGIHYIDGELLENSEFSKDPFEPVTKSYVPDIIHEQTDKNVKLLPIEQTLTEEQKKESNLYIFDAVTKEDIKNRLEELFQLEKKYLFAGCSGIAEFLAEILPFEKKEENDWLKTKNFLIISGSLNEITKKQIEFAEAQSYFSRIDFPIESINDKDFFVSENFNQLLNLIKQEFQNDKVVILDTFSLSKQEGYSKIEKTHKEKLRTEIPLIIGKTVKQILSEQSSLSVLLTGGETLKGLLDIVNESEIFLVSEIEPGVVVSKLKNLEEGQQILSKSGGFGTENLFQILAKKIGSDNIETDNR